MIKRMSMKELIAHQDKMRERLVNIYRKKPRTLMEVGKEIGISPMTLKAFMVEERDIELRSLCLIEDWILDKETKK